MTYKIKLVLASALLLAAGSALGQAHIRYLAHSGYAGVDMARAEFDRGYLNDARSLARLGDNRAQFNLAVMYHVRGEHTRARHWYHRAALFRHPLAAYNLGLMHYRGEGKIEQDYEEAFRWMEVSAKAGFPTAQLQLGIMIYRGEGTEPDPEREAYWYTQAALNGDPEAQFNLSVLYSMGEGVPHDLVNAYAWMKLANARGAAAQTELLMLESLLSADQKSQAEHRFRELSSEVRDLRETSQG